MSKSQKPNNAGTPPLLPWQTVHLRADCPPNNVRRFYCITLTKNLFSQWTLLVQWGRQETKGTQSIITCDSLQDAQTKYEEIVKKRKTAHNRIGCDYAAEEEPQEN